MTKTGNGPSAAYSSLAGIEVMLVKLLMLMLVLMLVSGYRRVISQECRKVRALESTNVWESGVGIPQPNK